MSSLDFVCPQCRGSLEAVAAAYVCRRCPRNYPVVLGIPDFRVFPDPYIDYADDHKKGSFLFERSAALSFEDLVRLYWQITPHVEEDRARQFMRSAFALVAKSLANLEEIDAFCSKEGPQRLDSVLEIGCGTGGFLVAAHGRFKQVVGVDIAFRWLVVARKRLEEAGCTVPLICACAEYLPFAAERFDLVAGDAVLEHVKDQRQTLQECHRVLSHKGVLFLGTANRFSITGEPHVRVWGVGFLPRRWMSRYVRLARGIPYRHITVLSYAELKRLLRNCSLHRSCVLLPPVPEHRGRDASVVERVQVRIYETLRGLPLLRLLLYVFGPYFHVLCRLDKRCQSSQS